MLTLTTPLEALIMVGEEDLKKPENGELSTQGPEGGAVPESDTDLDMCVFMQAPSKSQEAAFECFHRHRFARVVTPQAE